ncbi:MAG: 1-deoxy-D-xylulose-5-phosphate reductoisomerase [Muribaculaceae bacterium]|nr:1-deoxy-D-xylulose-5-phosphate reductoisomerase [Muribaculaceae bacterium]
METPQRKNIAILGSTGSIGTQALDIIENYPHLFHAAVLTANHNWELLAKQALKFRPHSVVIANDSKYSLLKEALQGSGINVLGGTDAIAEIVKLPVIDMVLTAMVGYSGLIPTVNAIEARKDIALANKETLVAAGEIIISLVKKHNVKILPVDSEHSAIFQCLVGENRKSMRKILLTASGGPFRALTKGELENVTVKDALNHPNWDMGNKVTIDSASMMNKGFEMIEAKWLFDCQPDDIEILVHPQSIVHSMVAFQDGSIKAQLGIPDMHIPIQYALSYPQRLPSEKYFLDWDKVINLSFELPDYDKFPLLRYAFDAIKKGGNMPCILNAANEVAVKAFLEEKIRFTRMPELVKYTMGNTPFVVEPNLSQIIETNSEAVKIAKEWVYTHC